MDDMNMMLGHISKEWSTKSLEDLYKQASAEKTGIAYDAITVPGKGRLVMVACFTKPDHVRGLPEYLGLFGLSPQKTWHDFALSDALMASTACGGVAAFLRKTDETAASALALSAADPCSVKIIESILS